MENIKFRKATIEDMEDIYKLSNDPEVRKVSINKNSISWEDHVKWFTHKIKDENVLFLIAYTDKISFLGQVRFDIEAGSKECTIGFSMVKSERGKGLGSKLLKGACDFLQRLNQENLLKIKAIVQSDNDASRKILTISGFEYMQDEVKNGITYNAYFKSLQSAEKKL